MEAKYIILIAVIFAATCAYLYFESAKKIKAETGTPKPATEERIKVTSVFSDNKKIPSKYTCDGENILPPLEISNIPADAKTICIIVDDPDAPAKTWTHWLLFNIPAISSEMKIKDSSLGTEGVNDFKKIGYDGPCPPSGIHHYHFKAYALSDNLALSHGAQKEEIEKEMQGKILAQGELVGLYQKNV